MTDFIKQFEKMLILTNLGYQERPAFQLRSLPLKYRWEASRRHPYYLDWWEIGVAHYSKFDLEHPVGEIFKLTAFTILGQIGISDCPPSPSTSFEELGGEELNPAWLSGAIHPLTFKAISSLPLAYLSKSNLKILGELFIQASLEDDPEDLPQVHKALSTLISFENQEFKMFPDEPIVSINPAASAELLEKSLIPMLKDWKSERNLSNRRDSSKKFDDYLEVWDLREGWTGSGYDSSIEMKLKEIATRRNQSLSTIHNQYRCAFQLITGYEYSPDFWYRIFGPLKLSVLDDSEPGDISKRRPLKNSSRKEVPESVLTTDAETAQFTGNIQDSGSGLEAWELANDILDLIKLGKTNEAITTELDLTEKGVMITEYFRNRAGEDLI